MRYRAIFVTPMRKYRCNSVVATKSVKSLSDPDIQDELKAVLTLYQQRRNHLDIKKTPDIFIHQVRSLQNR